MDASPVGLWAAYVARFGQGLTQQQVGDRAGVDQATVGRWLRGLKVPTEASVVAALAQGFGRNPLEAFVAAGFLTVDEAGRGLDRESTRLLDALREEVDRRAERAAVGEVAYEKFAAFQAAGGIVGNETISEMFAEAERELGVDAGPGPARRLGKLRAAEEDQSVTLERSGARRDRRRKPRGQNR